MRARRLPRIAALAAGLALLPAPAGRAHDARPAAAPLDPALTAEPRLVPIRRAPDLTLLDTAGRPVRLSALRGRVVLISFVYTTCSTACPLLTARLAALQARLEEADPGGRAQLLSVTVDPARDTAAVLARYAARFGADPRRWRFLREAPARLAPVLAAYDEWTRTPAGGEIDHPARLHLIDGDGRVREIYTLAFFDDRQAFLDILALLGEGR